MDAKYVLLIFYVSDEGVIVILILKFPDHLHRMHVTVC